MSQNQDLASRLVEVQGSWWHSIDLGDFGTTQGHKSAALLDREWRNLRIPSLKGLSVLDVGSWDGYFAFRAEREGAGPVTALDHYVWSFDPLEKLAYEQGCRNRGEVPKPWDEVPELWRPTDLPGKRLFDLAHEALGSNVNAVVADFMTEPVEDLPKADIVLFLGVLYHLKDMIEAFRRLRLITGSLAVIETEAIDTPRYEGVPLAQFASRDQISGDPTNWWAPNEAALIDLALSAGFSRAEPIRNESAREHATMEARARRLAKRAVRRVPFGPGARIHPYRAVIHAWA